MASHWITRDTLGNIHLTKYSRNLNNLESSFLCYPPKKQIQSYQEIWDTGPRNSDQISFFLGWRLQQTRALPQQTLTDRLQNCQSQTFLSVSHPWESSIQSSYLEDLQLWYCIKCSETLSSGVVFCNHGQKWRWHDDGKWSWDPRYLRRLCHPLSLSWRSHNRHQHHKSPLTNNFQSQGFELES